jgi:hypothetical protein
MGEPIGSRVRRWLVDRIIAYLTEPLGHYEQRTRNDLDALQSHLRKADVLLVEGDQRVSAIVRYLTQSSWSHSALYIGDELLRRGGERAEWARRQFGAEAEHLLVEALPHGVVASPVARYVDFNVRICRPHGLRPADAQRILDEAVATIGWRYDLRNVLDLARYLIPVRLVPDRWRTGALHFGSGQPTEVICSSLLARLFHGVRFPILPTQVVPPPGSEAAAVIAGAHEPAARVLARRVFGQPSRREYTGLFRMRHPTLVTPRDFDLSPYFDVVKFNPLARGDFDYSRIRWAEETGDGPAKRAIGDGPATRGTQERPRS